MKRIAIVVLAVVLGFNDVGAREFVSPSNSLTDTILSIVSDVPAEIGVSFASDDGMTVGISENEQFPLLSVVKFHQALAVCNELKGSGRTIGDIVTVNKSGLANDTWSPMVDKYPNGGKFTIEKLLWYSLVMSDNNACDLLFDNVVNIEKAQMFIDSLLSDGCQIAVDEKTMRKDLKRCYDNWTTPGAALSLMKWFYCMKDEPLYNNVWRMMAECNTGKNRISRYLGDDAVVVHKTGTGPSVEGKIIAINDLACVILPDGKYFFLSVFIKDAECSIEQCEATIAEIARTCLKYMRNGYPSGKSDGADGKMK